jgi:hypothetical protein
MKNQTDRLFTESLLPSIPNGPTLRRFKRYVMNQVDSVGMDRCNAEYQEPPTVVILGRAIVVVDDRGQAHLCADHGPNAQDRNYIDSGTL